MNKRLLTAITAAFFITLLSVFPAMAAEPEEEDGNSAWDDIRNFVVGLVVPSDDFFKEEYDKLDDKIRPKLPYQTYIDTIGRLKDVADCYADGNYAYDVSAVYDNNGDATVDGSISFFMGLMDKFGAPFKTYFQPVIIGLYTLFLAHYNYRQIYFLIRAADFSGFKDGSGKGAKKGKG